MGCKTAGNVAGQPSGIIDREEAMARFAIVALSAFSIVFAVGPAARAQVTSCSGVLSGHTVHHNLLVPDGATCVLHELTVVGNVLVGTNAALQLGAGTHISGNILAHSCNYVEEVGLAGVTQTPIVIGGNVEINNCTVGGDFGSESGFPSFTVRGNLSCVNNGSFCALSGAEIGGNARFINNHAGVDVGHATIGGNLSVSDNTIANDTGENVAISPNNVGGNVQVNNNTGGVIVGGNEIGGNLRCRGNPSGVTDDNSGPNTVDGKKQGQCAGL
jgi:hypothetical protein